MINIYTMYNSQLSSPDKYAYLREKNLYTQFKIFLPLFPIDIHKFKCTNFSTIFQLFFGNIKEDKNKYWVVIYLQNMGNMAKICK